VNGYSRALRLRHLRLAGWHRELLGWGMVVLGALLALTGLLSPWGILVLPLLMAAVIKVHDALTGRLASAAAGFPEVRDSNEAPNDDEAGNTNEAQHSNEPPIQRTGGSE
jgi:hypothetical protein